MQDRDFWEKCAVLVCHDIDAFGKKDTGSYYNEEQITFLMWLNERDLIRCMRMPGHKMRIIGFGEVGRKVYLDTSGDILPHYKLPV